MFGICCQTKGTQHRLRKLGKRIYTAVRDSHQRGLERLVRHGLRRKLTEVGHAIFFNDLWLGLGYIVIQLLQVTNTCVVKLADTLQSDSAVYKSMYEFVQQDVGTSVAIDQLNLVCLCIVLTCNDVVTISTQCTFRHQLNRWQLVGQQDTAGNCTVKVVVHTFGRFEDSLQRTPHVTFLYLGL